MSTCHCRAIEQRKAIVLTLQSKDKKDLLEDEYIHEIR
jgi:hypothetical protein